MTIHSEHPFDTPPGERDAVRRLRGRLVSGVTIWTAAGPDGPAGLTVSSMLVAGGTPGRVLALLDPASDLFAAAVASRRVAISVLGGNHRYLADAFAGIAPAPGGMFRLGEWRESPFGPLLADAVATAGVLVDASPRTLGWSALVEGTLEDAQMGADSDLLAHVRGRYAIV